MGAIRAIAPGKSPLRNDPDASAVARILLAAPPNPELIFNYASEENRIWRQPENQRRLRYSAAFPKAAPGMWGKLV